MANVSEKFGLRPYKTLGGHSWNNQQNRYTISANYGTAIFQGDLVIPATDGDIERHTAGAACGHRRRKTRPRRSPCAEPPVARWVPQPPASPSRRRRPRLSG